MNHWTGYRKLMWLRKLKGGASWTLETLTGPLPLQFTAIRKNIKSLIRYGKCVQISTPTPSEPASIECNNGTLKMVHRSGLPDGYKLLEYVGGSGSQYVVTDVYLASTDVIECEFRNSTTTGYGAVYGIFKNAESSALYGNQTYYGYDVSNNKVDTRTAVDTEWHSSRHDFVNGTLTIDETTVSFEPFEFANSTKNAVLSRYYNNNYGYNWKGYVRKFKVTRGSEVICDLLPCENGQGVAGFYDLANSTFYQPTGGTLLKGNEVDDYEFAIVGTPEVLSIESQAATVQALFGIGAYEDEQDIISGRLTRKIGIKVFTGEETWTSGNNGWISQDAITDQLNDIYQPVCTHFVGTTTTPGADSNTVRVYLTSGGVPRVYFGVNKTTYSTAAEWQAWLAGQHASGTPVILIYPLEEVIQERVQAQPLMSDEGTNLVYTSTSISGAKAKIEYYAEASS